MNNLKQRNLKDIVDVDLVHFFVNFNTFYMEFRRFYYNDFTAII